jgi:hypothetical protein
MAKLRTPVEELLLRFANLYGSPEASDPKGYLGEYTTALEGFAPEIVKKIGDRVIGENTYKMWPTPGACKTAGNTIAAEQANDAKRYVHQRESKHLDPAWSDHAVRKADSLIKGELGQQAAREGWIVGLHDYCRKHGKLANPWECGEMIVSAEFAARAAAGVFDKPVHPAMLATLKRAGDAMLAKRERLTDMVLGALVDESMDRVPEYRQEEQVDGQ